jgi:hypothetical protein
VDTHIERVIRQDKQKGSVHLCGTKAFIEENLLKRECKTKKKKQYTNKHANCKQVFLTSLFLLFFFFEIIFFSLDYFDIKNKILFFKKFYFNIYIFLKNTTF